MGVYKSKILIIGGTGHIGKFIVEASAKFGHPTFALLRETTISNPAKAQLIQGFNNSGVTILKGDLDDFGSLVKGVKQVDVVISAVGQVQILDQHKIIAAIKEAGNIKRFLPSEFGNDVDRSRAVEPAKSAWAAKAEIRRAVEAACIPYTYVTANLFAACCIPTLTPPAQNITIFGDGNLKGVFNEEHDVAAYTIHAVDDPRTVNKIVYIKPPGNIYSMNAVVGLWEKKIGKTLHKVYISEQQLLKQIADSAMPVKMILAINHSVFINADQTYFQIHPSFGVEASRLYPHLKYLTLDQYLNQFL